jgi:inward rectifier potassium channel
MTWRDKIHFKSKREINTGFGSNASEYGGRLINKKGSANVEKKGIGLLERISWYHSMLSIPRWKFISIIFLFFFVINLGFGTIYYLLGVQHLGGVIPGSALHNFAEAFFFSCQTFTTVGYGKINPNGLFSNALAASEALVGLLSFALATGLLYGRFSKPTAFLKFSENALIAPFKEGTALMLRLAPFKNTTLTEAEAKITLGISLNENGKQTNEFYQLQLEYSTVNALNLSWTIVHPITEESPLHNLTAEDYANMQGEVLVFIKAFDDMFSNTVVSRTSYTFKEIVVGAKFNPMFKRSSEGNKTVLHIDKLNSYSIVELNKLISAP